MKQFQLIRKRLLGFTLTITVGDHWSPKRKQKWAEGKRWRHESRLERILEGIEVAARYCKAYFAESNRREQGAQEKRRREEEEQARIRTFASQLARWREAREIREFVADVRERSSGSGSHVESWIQWTLKYADAIDPVLQAIGFPATAH